MRRRLQRGTAVITALLMVVIVTAISVSLITHQRISIMRTRQIVQSRQAFFHAQGALYWARSALKKQISDNQEWPMVLPETELPDGQGRVQAEIMALSVMPNVNDGGNADVKNKILEAMQAIDEVDEEQINRIMGALSAWINTAPSVEYDEFYLSQDPAYRAAHQPMLSISEMRLLSGMDARIYEAIRHQVVAYPITGGGDYYLLTTNVELGSQRLTVYSILHRTQDKGKVLLKPIWQSRGAL